MPTPVLAVVKLGKKSGILADRPTMDFAFSVADPLLAGITLALASLEAFFKTATTSGFALQSFLSPSLSTGAASSEISWYDLTGHLDGTRRGAGPIQTNTWNLTSLGADPALPDQIACALSYHSDYGTDVEFGVGTRPRARDRGRVFIGPLAAGNTVDDDATTHEPMWGVSFRDTIAAAATRLLSDGVGWSVWSRRDAALKPVVGGWIDNRPDVQRRRAQLASSRVSWT